jgi:hypothetical protein
MLHSASLVPVEWIELPTFGSQNLAIRVARRRFGVHIHPMGHIDSCLNVLCRLIAAGDTNGIQMAQNVIEEYWAATPVRARKSGLLYMQQILHDQRDAAGPNSRDMVVIVDAYIEKKLVT